MKITHAGSGFALLDDDDKILAFQVQKSDLLFYFHKLGFKIQQVEIDRAVDVLQTTRVVRLNLKRRAVKSIF